MKTLGKIVGGVAGTLAVLVLLFVAYARVFGFDAGPWRPGLWIRGETVTAHPDDWTFAKDRGGNTMVQTRDHVIPGLAFSVTTARFIHDGDLYLGSGYATGVMMPGARRWNQNIVADPVVRVRIDGNVYDGRLVYLDDQEIQEAICRDYGQRISLLWQPGYFIHLWRFEPLA
ncbi:MAG: hypothetical protein FJW23_12895 [Acidimicrobiia bacterium]|nr:hypothetical protein [Acidimicrobiia bacterium]